MDKVIEISHYNDKYTQEASKFYVLLSRIETIGISCIGMKSGFIIYNVIDTKTIRLEWKKFIEPNTYR
jgi:hypothetical protein